MSGKSRLQKRGRGAFRVNARRVRDVFVKQGDLEGRSNRYALLYAYALPVPRFTFQAGSESRGCAYFGLLACWHSQLSYPHLRIHHLSASQCLRIGTDEPRDKSRQNARDAEPSKAK